MINLYNELKSFTPIDLDSILKTNPEISEDFRTSVMLYNNALENLKMNSEDIAVIELKKAVAMNPDFNEAVTLLGLCFYYMKAYEKAEEMFDRVAKAESNGVRAFNYLKTVRDKDNSEYSENENKNKKSRAKKSDSRNSDSRSTRASSSRSSSSNVLKNNKQSQSITQTTMPKAIRQVAQDTSYAVPKSVSRSMPELPLRVKLKGNKKDELVKYATGIIIGLIIAFVIGVPSIFGAKTDKKTDIKNENENIVVLTEKIKEYEDKNNQLSVENDNLKKELEKTQTDTKYYESAIKLFEADELVKGKKYEEAADILVTIKNIGFNSIEKEKYDKLLNDTMQRASDIVYSQAYNLFQTGKFEEALDKYIKIPEYTDDYRKMDIVLYYIGKSYLELKDNENATKAFEKVISKFPNSEYAGYSQSRLNGITSN